MIDDEYRSFSVHWCCNSIREAEQFNELLAKYYDTVPLVFDNNVNFFKFMMGKQNYQYLF